MKCIVHINTYRLTQKTNRPQTSNIVNMSADISELEKIESWDFRLYACTQRSFVTQTCHAHSSAHNTAKTAAPTVLMLE